MIYYRDTIVKFKDLISVAENDPEIILCGETLSANTWDQQYYEQIIFTKLNMLIWHDNHGDVVKFAISDPPSKNYLDPLPVNDSSYMDWRKKGIFIDTRIDRQSLMEILEKDLKLLDLFLMNLDLFN